MVSRTRGEIELMRKSQEEISQILHLLQPRLSEFGSGLSNAIGVIRELCQKINQVPGVVVSENETGRQRFGWIFQRLQEMVKRSDNSVRDINSIM